jgi:hypothetical protein
VKKAFHLDKHMPPHQLISELYGYWDSLREGNSVPKRADFDPFANPRLLSHLTLLDVEGIGRYRIRLAGENVTRLSGRHLKGREIDALLYGESTPLIINMLDTVYNEKVTLLVRGYANFHQDIFWGQFDLLLMPLADAIGNITHLLGGWVTIDEYVDHYRPTSSPALDLISVTLDPFGASPQIFPAKPLTR